MGIGDEWRRRMKNLLRPSSEKLESRYKLSQAWSGWAQVLAAIVSIVTVLIAIWVAKQGQNTVTHDSQTALQQSENDQLSTAITALGSSDTAERISGVLLLAHNAITRFKLSAESGEPADDVYSNYVTALEILDGYIRSHGEDFLSSTSTGSIAYQFGRGYGNPPAKTLGVMPIDINYAADELNELLAQEEKVVALRNGRPAIDLSFDDLYQQYWEGVNFSWVTAYMPGIDLRGADLRASQWGVYSNLKGAYLQCADLEWADFRGADLSGADLRGANVQGADFRGAKITNAQITQLYGTAKWPSWQHDITANPVKEWNQATCLKNSHLWDNQPSAPASQPSPTPSPSATAEPSASKGRQANGHSTAATHSK